MCNGWPPCFTSKMAANTIALRSGWGENLLPFLTSLVLLENMCWYCINPLSATEKVDIKITKLYWKLFIEFKKHSSSNFSPKQICRLTEFIHNIYAPNECTYLIQTYQMQPYVRVVLQSVWFRVGRDVSAILQSLCGLASMFLLQACVYAVC